MSPRPVLFGVDVVDVGRVNRAMAHSGPAYAAHVSDPAEAALHPDPVLATAASVAVKECLVKAVGGRPTGFSWHDFAATGDTPYAGREWAGPLLTEAVGPVEEATEVALTEQCTYVVRGASGQAALTRFTGRTGEDTPSAAEPTVVGAARWGWRGDLIVAVAILTPISEEML